jgi:hypothetical protein
MKGVDELRCTLLSEKKKVNLKGVHLCNILERDKTMEPDKGSVVIRCLREEGRHS